MRIHVDIQTIRAYSQAIAYELCERFFPKRKKVVAYHKLASFCSSKQVNLFILKILYELWKRESRHWKSAYFNYQSPDLLKSNVRFFNMVVKTATFHRKDAEAVLARAVEDTLWLLFSPYTFYMKVMDLKDDVEITLDELKVIGKYIVINKRIMKELMTHVRATHSDRFLGKDVVQALTKVFEEMKQEPEETDSYMEVFKKIIPHHGSFYKVINPKDQLHLKEEIATPFNQLSYSLNEILTDYELPPNRVKDFLTILTDDQKNYFIKGLFQNNESDFLKMLSDLDRCISSHQAIGLLQAVYVPQYNWNMESQLYKGLLQLVESRFI